MRRMVQEGVCEIYMTDPSAVSAAKAALSDPRTLERTAEAFKALAHPNRLRILKALEGRELCVCDLSQVTGLSMSGTSQQVRELNNLGAVAYRAAGRFAYYRISDPFWLHLAESVIGYFDTDKRAVVPARGPGRVSG